MSEVPSGPMAVADATTSDTGIDKHGCSETSETCAICLDHVSMFETAIIPGCGHTYCVTCVLQWAVCRDPCSCPQCKQPFSYLYVHRQLDGTLSDCLIEESVVLLKRTPWFQNYIRSVDKTPLLGAGSATDPSDWFGAEDDYDEDDDDAYDDADEQLLDMYYSRATGRSRIVIGNRRWGENGHVRGGRMYARPVAAAALSASKVNVACAGKTGKAAAAAAAGSSGDSRSVRNRPVDSMSTHASNDIACLGNEVMAAGSEPTPSAVGCSSGVSSTGANAAAQPGQDAVDDNGAGSGSRATGLRSGGGGGGASRKVGNKAGGGGDGGFLKALVREEAQSGLQGTSRNQGRRAKRAGRRAAADLAWDYEDNY